MFLQQTAAGGLCALFLLLLQRIFRNLLSPRWQYGIWGVLVLRLLIPAGVWGRSTVLDVWPWLEAARAGTAESSRQAVTARAASREEKRDSFIKNNSFPQ